MGLEMWGRGLDESWGCSLSVSCVHMTRRMLVVLWVWFCQVKSDD